MLVREPNRHFGYASILPSEVRNRAQGNARYRRRAGRGQRLVEIISPRFRRVGLLRLAAQYDDSAERLRFKNRLKRRVVG